MSTILGDIITIGGKLSGSGDEIYALIKVTYPSGSTCVATNGTTTLTAENTSGQVVFGISEPTSTPETWTVSCTDGTDSSSKTLSITEYGQVKNVTLAYVPSDVNDATWEQISKISIAGTGDAYWDVGDCKAIQLNGNIGDYLTLSNTTLYVFILDFNHPINKTTTDNNIIWGGFKTASGGTDVALCDSNYGTTSYNGSIKFNENHFGKSSSPYNTNYGGWKGCDFRYDILGGTSTAPSPYNTTKTTSTTGSNATQATIDTPVANTLMAALPSDLRNVIRLWSRYIDYVGNQTNVDSSCNTPTIDALSLLSEFEVFGVQQSANPYEQNHQTQMAYYTNSNSKIKYKHNNSGTSCIWWLASPHNSSSSAFCLTKADGTANGANGRYSYGLAPAFRT